MPKYYVHLYPSVRVKVEVEAESQVEAIDKAIDKVDFHDLFDSNTPRLGCLYTECDENEEIGYAFVDEADDNNYQNSRSYKLLNGQWEKEVILSKEEQNESHEKNENKI